MGSWGRLVAKDSSISCSSFCLLRPPLSSPTYRACKYSFHPLIFNILVYGMTFENFPLAREYCPLPKEPATSIARLNRKSSLRPLLFQYFSKKDISIICWWQRAGFSHHLLGKMLIPDSHLPFSISDSSAGQWDGSSSKSGSCSLPRASHYPPPTSHYCNVTQGCTHLTTTSI